LNSARQNQDTLQLGMYHPFWNLDKQHPITRLDLKVASQKLATLLALTTAQRLQTLALINIDNISVAASNISIKITENIKTSRPGSFQPDLVLPFFKDRPGLCVASVVLDFVNITKELRGHNIKNLFITTKKPFRATSAQTIGHWIKDTLQKAGIDTSQFTAYSTKHAAVSTDHKRGVDIVTIRRTAGWSPQSQVFFKFYNKPIYDPNDQFARAILQ